MLRLVVVKFLPANPNPGTAYGWHDLRCAAELMRCSKACPRCWKHAGIGDLGPISVASAQAALYALGQEWQI
jgi:hypothetical protein